MANPMLPAGTRIFIQSAISAQQTITEISKANPGVVTYEGTDPENNAYVAIQNVNGMTILDDALVKVANVDIVEKNFEMKGQDTSDYPDFESGFMSPLVIGTELKIATGLAMSGGDPKYASFQFLWDLIERQLPAGFTPITVSIPCIFDPADPGLVRSVKASDTQSKLAIKLLFTNGLELLFFGYISAPGLPNITDLASVITTNVSVSLSTRPRFILPV
ncbi:phage tail tube protein [Methylophaga sp.]|uniref:phage tail tube protein n=1 Tax=Methylophaga sp. TaxID=2024840 RepID=UPI003A913750